jgi:hypothetical protein
MAKFIADSKLQHSFTLQNSLNAYSQKCQQSFPMQWFLMSLPHGIPAHTAGKSSVSKAF